MRTLNFASRNLKELLRDPLSYIFCLGFPIIMLIIMSVINKSIPPQANMTIFNIDNLSAGISVFGMTFIMLFTALHISKDRSSAFLIRLYVSPMKPAEFIMGYTLPIILMAVIQCLITYISAFIISIILDSPLSIPDMLMSCILLIPSEIMFIGFGILFGSIFNDKSAPALCSIVITLSCLLGGIWLDVDNLSAGMKTLCRALPFYYSVKTGRMAVSGNYSFDDIGKSMIVVLIYMIIIYIISIVTFNLKMQKDQK